MLVYWLWVARLNSMRKNSILLLFLGGAALQRCGKCIVLNPALAAEGAGSAQKRLFPAACEDERSQKPSINPL
jgi:hypothetical protein